MEENPRINEINGMLDLMEDILEDSKQAFLSQRVAVDKEEMFDIIKDIRLRLPNEIQQSRWVVEDRAKILAKAQAEADLIIEEAHEQVDRMVREHEITRFAEEQAQGIINAAHNHDKEMRLGTLDYVDDAMKTLERQLKDTLDVVHQEMSGFQTDMSEIIRTVYANRQELKGGSRQQPIEEYEYDDEDEEE